MDAKSGETLGVYIARLVRARFVGEVEWNGTPLLFGGSEAQVWERYYARREKFQKEQRLKKWPEKDHEWVSELYETEMAMINGNTSHQSALLKAFAMGREFESRKRGK